MKQNRRFNISSFVIVLLAVNVTFLSPCLSAAKDSSVLLITDSNIGPAGRHGVNKVRLALQTKGIPVEQTTSLETTSGNLLLVVGLSAGSGPAAELHDKLDISRPKGAESLLIRRTIWSGKKTLLVSGADDRGLMYALLDIANRIGWNSNLSRPFSEVRNVQERPAVPERALSIYTMHQANFESYFYNEDYWARYLDMLAENRFNTFALLLGYENWGYFTPPYPYFFDVEEFPDIKVVGITEQKQHRNLAALNRFIDMTHERGMNFTLGIWDHIYRGGVQGPRDRVGKPTEGIVWGLTADNLTAYTRVALTKLLKLVPEIDAIQFRMHGESGLKRTE
ncbi:MAG: beta-N-acetylhexosaminidase family protein, partial [Planctomycetota bacterium]